MVELTLMRGKRHLGSYYAPRREYRRRFGTVQLRCRRRPIASVSCFAPSAASRSAAVRRFVSGGQRSARREGHRFSRTRELEQPFYMFAVPLPDFET